MAHRIRIKIMLIGCGLDLIQFVLLAFLSLFLLSVLACGGGGGGGSSPIPTPTDTGAEKNIGSAGGTVEVTNQNSPIYGAKVEIPANALTSNTDIRISISASQPPIPDSNYTRLDQMKETIQFSPSGIKFNSPVMVTMPFDKNIDSNFQTVIAAVYDENKATWKVPRIIDIDNTKKLLTIELSHFSQIDRFMAKPGSDLSIDTSPVFNLSVDSFNIINFKDSNHPDGHCFGFTSFAKWYFENERDSGYLKESYDETNARNIVNEAQDLQGKAINSALDILTKGKRDKMTADNILAALHIEKSPQILNIASSPSPFFSSWHSVLVYKFASGFFYVYDPNYADSSFKKIYYSSGDLVAYEGGLYDWFVHQSSEEIHSDKLKGIFDKYPRTPMYALKYSQDFSSEPGWITNNTSRFYRDTLTNTFFATTVESAEEYATIPVNWTGNSFKIEFDIKIATSQFASGISVGLFDADRHDSLPNVVDVIYGNSNDGLHVNLHAANSTTSKGAPSTIQNVQINVWYHNVITWDKDTGTVTLELTNRDTGAAIGTYAIDGFTSFPTNMNSLGVSWVGHNASTNRTTSYIDNVKFYEKGGQSQDLTGYWDFYYTKTGGSEMGPFISILNQSGTTLSVSPYACLPNESQLPGSISGSNISLSFPDGSDTVTLTGIAGANSLSGTYFSTSGETGPWRAARRATGPICSKPYVVSTNPSNGQIGVSRTLQWITVTFSEPMAPSRDVAINGSWPVSNSTSYTWSSDNRTFSFSRDNAGISLPSNSSFIFSLGQYFKSAGGVSIDPFQFSFTTGN